MDSTYTVDLQVMRSGYDAKTCLVNPWPAVEPGTGRALLTLQQLNVTGSDVFYGAIASHSEDLGQSWSEIVSVPELGRIPLPGVPFETCVNDLKPAWHAASGTLLAHGVRVYYQEGSGVPSHIEPNGRGAQTTYLTCDLRTRQWSKPKTLAMPDEPRFWHAVAGSAQRYDLPGGDILLPIYFIAAGETNYGSIIARCSFDGEVLTVEELGNALTVPEARGLYEPSVTAFGDRFLLTLRQDLKGYVATSTDGIHYGTPQPWTFDDGQELGSYNTQQHWLTHGDRLYLVYTRRGLDNDHVFRHRAPLVMAQVDPERLCVIRQTERMLVPERGARLGNFGVIDASPTESWVTVAEWMQPAGCESYGSDNSVYIARIHWQD